MLTVEGTRWAVVSLRGGFSGMHTVLRPDMGRDDFRPAQRVVRQRQAVALEPVLLDLFSRCRAWVQAALGIPELAHSSLQELQDARRIVETAGEALEALRPRLREARRERPELGRLARALEVWAAAVEYQQRDLQAFWQTQLGTAQEVAR